MLSSLLAVIVALLCSLVSADVDLALVTASLPQCATTCSVTLLGEALCPLTDMRNCLCTNITLQYELFSCVLNTCDIEDQVTATLVSQNLICNGLPVPSRSAEIIRTVIIISAFAFTLIGLRLLSRYMVATFWWDDWFMVVATICMIPMTVIPILNATKGFGTHAWTVPPQNITLIRQLYYVSQILYVIVQNNAKIAVLLLYLRIFPTVRFRLATKICLGWMTCHLLAFLLVVTLQCVPVTAIWDLTIRARCVSDTGIVYAGAALSIVEDIVIVALPVPQLQGLNLNLKKRIALILMFAIGSFACVTSMIRLKYIVSFSTNSLDATWGNTDVVIWSIVEIYTAMICASLMSIRPLLVKYFPSLFPTTAAHDYSGTTSWRPKESANASARIWSGGPTGSEVELRSRAEEEDKGAMKVHRDFEITDTRLDDVSGSEGESVRDRKVSAARSM